MLLVLVAVGGATAWVSQPDAQSLGPAPASATSPSARTVPSVSGGGALLEAELRLIAMVDRLAQRVKAKPENATDWEMLGRSYAALGKHAEALPAFQSAARLRPDDPTLLADYALSSAIANRREANGEPAQLVARALTLDPNNPKALALAGSLAFDRRDYRGATRFWEKRARLETPDSPVARQIQASLAEARRLAGMDMGQKPGR
jgi:cytochrome c-type biogenesis protein CcmH